MKVILHGGKSHGSMLHAVPKNLQTFTEHGEQYRYAEFLPNSNVAVFNTSKRKLQPETLSEWTRLLSDPAVFKGSKTKSTKRKLQTHEPADPEHHGDKYVRNCFRLHKK